MNNSCNGHRYKRPARSTILQSRCLRQSSLEIKTWKILTILALVKRTLHRIDLQSYQHRIIISLQRKRYQLQRKRYQLQRKHYQLQRKRYHSSPPPKNNPPVMSDHTVTSSRQMWWPLASVSVATSSVLLAIMVWYATLQLPTTVSEALPATASPSYHRSCPSYY